MTHPSFPRLLGDVGGTHARFAWQAAAGDALTSFATERCANHDSLAAVIRHYLSANGRPAPEACAIGIANPITGDAVRMTNNHWSFSIDSLQRELGVRRLLVINDFMALALALPVLGPENLRQIGRGRMDQDAPRAVIGPGTGLGVSCLLPERHAGVAITGEGGHVTLAAADEREDAIIACLRKRFGHVSAERVLSGPGLVNLHAAVAKLRRRPCGEPLAPPQVIERGLSGSDPLAAEALDLFCGFLGSVAGDLALTLGARGGVYVGGGIVPRLGSAFDTSVFRKRFEAKGRFEEYLADIPTFVIVSEYSPALLGASRALDLRA